MSGIVAHAMAQHQLDALSATDASFLAQERGGTHMHIGGVVLLEGPAPDFPTFREYVRERLRLVPRYRQRLVFPPLGLGRPRWVDDATFNIDYHLRHSGLPGAADEAALWRQIGRVFSHRLDRTKPLWEAWLIDGLADGRWAVGAKTHHAIVDGRSGMDLLSVLFDARPDAEPVRVADAWMPRPRPTGVELAAAGLRDAASEGARVTSALVRPRRLLRAARGAAEGLSETAWSVLAPAPPTPLNVPIGPHRAYTVVQAPLEDFRTVKNALGGTVNDVVLAVVAGGLARWLHARGLRTEGLEPRAGVPVSVRADPARGVLGNRLAQVVVPLPIAVHDPVERLAVVRAAMDGIKASGRAVDAESIAAMDDMAPPTILAQASRLDFGSRLYNLLVTNIPGPQVPLYLLGRRVEELYPVPFLVGDRALAVAVVSYAGNVGFGLLADPDVLDDLDVVAQGIEASLAELLARARGQQPDGLGLRARPRRRPARRDRGKRARPGKAVE
ncbi:MAG TPA: wax ester/triacylglycerol synthase family O-acyltransferase [Capillimicrobium sp.]|nr:wax ester/triacylglycerol synthase family O-acyltransferase [Capillimicrobium sp.]